MLLQKVISDTRRMKIVGAVFDRPLSASPMLALYIYATLMQQKESL